MFESVLNVGKAGESWLGTGALISIALHAAVLAGALWLSGRTLATAPRTKNEPRDWPVASLGKGGPIKRGDNESSKQTEGRRNRRRAPFVAGIPVATKTERQTIPRDEAPEPISDEGSDAGTAADTTGSRGDGANNAPCTAADCSSNNVTAAPISKVLPFGPGMTPPRLLDPGKAIGYTRQASEAHVQGTMLVQCVLTVEGRVTSCRVIHSVPFMEGAVLRALETRRYTPVLFQGRPVPVKYNFAIKLKSAE